jgi:ATP-binding cassette subfamily C protein
MTLKEIFGVLVHKSKFLVTIYLLTSIASWLISLLLPFVMGRFIDQLVYGKDNKDASIVYHNAWLLIAFATIELLAIFYSKLFRTHLKNKAIFSLIFKIYNHVERLHISYLDSINKNYLTQRINQDVNQLYAFILENGVSLIFSILSFFIITIIIFRVNYIICLSFLILVPIYAFLFILFRKKLFKEIHIVKELQNDFLATLNYQLSKVRTIKTNAWFELFDIKLKKKYNKVFDSTMTYSRTSYHCNNIDIFIKRIANIMLFFYGGILLIQAKITIGYFTAINAYFNILISSISFFLQFGQSYQQTLVCYKRIQQILLLKQENNGIKYIDEINKINFNNVGFSYNEKELIRDLTLEFKKGNIYIIIGKNGSGKTTFLDLLIGLNKEYTGEIYFNDQNIKDLDFYKIRSNLFGVVEQVTELISDDFFENLLFGLDNIDNIDVKKVCQDFGISKLLEKKITNVSGGEKQKITIARTILKSPNIWVLDEPTSSLDKKGKEYLISHLKCNKKDRIIVLITHDEDLIREADYIISF